MSKLRIFVSSVQYELENERVAIAELISSDAFLSRHCQAILFESLPASPAPAEKGYMAELSASDAYVGIIGAEYGNAGPDGLSAMHREYNHAVQRRMPVFVFVKGQAGRDKDRSDSMKALFARVRDPMSGHLYRRFGNYQDLKRLVRDALLSMLKKRGITPSEAETAEFIQTLGAASDFDVQLIAHARYADLDANLAGEFVSAVLGRAPKSKVEILQTLLNRGLLWRDEKSGRHRPTAAGLLLMGKSPDSVYPQCRIAANAYGGCEKGDPIDRRDIRKPLPVAIQETIDFLIRNMRHAQTVRGFERVALDEYPYEALREAIINAVAHRDYGLQGSCIRVEKYADRVVVLSPGLPPLPLTLARLRSLKYLPCSRNPNIARGLSFFERIEEQGDGLRRMIAAAKDAGLPPPDFANTDGYFTVIFRGPGKSMAGLKPQKARPVFSIEPSLLDQLTSNQKTIVRKLLKTATVQVPEIAARLRVTPQAIRKDMAALQRLGLVEKRGSARATYYVLKERNTAA